MLIVCILPNVDSYSKEMAAKNDTKALALSVSEHKQISSIVDYLQKGSLTRLDPKDYALLNQMLKWPLKMIFPGTCTSSFVLCVIEEGDEFASMERNFRLLNCFSYLAYN